MYDTVLKPSRVVNVQVGSSTNLRKPVALRRDRPHLGAMDGKSPTQGRIIFDHRIDLISMELTAAASFRATSFRRDENV